MNDTIISLIFFILILFIYIIVVLIKDKIENSKLTKREQINKFKLTLFNMPEYEIIQYNKLKAYILQNKYISTNILYNKELYYLKEKLVLKVTLRTNSISYKFKHKELLK